MLFYNLKNDNKLWKILKGLKLEPFREKILA